MSRNSRHSLLLLQLTIFLIKFLFSRGIAKIGEPNNLLVNSIRGGGAHGGYYDIDPPVQAILRKKQQRIIRENRGVLQAIAKGAGDAVSECKHQFRTRRWNCPTKSFWRGGKNIFGKIVDRGE